MLIYLVDDDPEDQEIFEMALEETGLKVTMQSFNNGLVAIEHLENAVIKPKFIFLDLNMPKINGFECLQLLVKKDLIQHSSVIIYSTSSNEKDIFQSKASGASQYLVKPVNFNTLVNSVREVLGKQD